MTDDTNNTTNATNTNVPKKGIQIRVQKKWEFSFTRPDGTEHVITATSRAELVRKVAEALALALGKQKQQ